QRALACVLVSACTSQIPPTPALKPALTCPAAGGAKWREYVTPHFVLRSDLPQSEATSYLDAFERAQFGLMSQFPDLPEPSPTQVVLFARWRDFAEMKVPPDGDCAGGYFHAESDGAFRVPTIVMHTSANLQHELFHRLLLERVPNAPTWLNEGLAGYYSTMVVEDNRIILGKIDWGWNPSIQIPALLAATRANFSAPGRGTYYATAWAFVQLLR